MNNRPSSNTKWVYDSPIHSDVEAKLRGFLVELGDADKILGIQVCAYKDGQVIIDTAAGFMGKDDPRPVRLDTLFPVFSSTKGVTAGIMHWLADKGILKLDENVANIWPEFAINGKNQIKVHQILNHTAGLHNALADLLLTDFITYCDWDECVKRVAMVAPETDPGREQFYHIVSYGWLCGAIIERATGKKFMDILEEAFIRPLDLEGELFMGVPPGVESRLATCMFDTTEFSTLIATSTTTDAYGAMPSSFDQDSALGFVDLCNRLDYRRVLQPAGSGNFSARALARYYAALVDGGIIPPSTKTSTKIFNNPKSKIHDAFLGTGDFKDLALQDGKFGLGFKRVMTTEGSVIGFGHAGVGGAVGYADINNRFSIAVTLNKMSFGALTTAEILRFVCSELNIPVPEEYAGPLYEKPVIN